MDYFFNALKSQAKKDESQAKKDAETASTSSSSSSKSGPVDHKILAEASKRQGNAYFGQQLYKEAVDCYSTAIVQNPDVPTYYTNRALCHLRQDSYAKVIADCNKALSMDPTLVKAHYLLGEALLQSGDNHSVFESVGPLRRAYNLALEQKQEYAQEICQTFLQAKKQRWAIQDKRRREESSELYLYLTALMEREKQRQLSQLDESVEVETIHVSHKERLGQLESLFETANDPGKVL